MRDLVDVDDINDGRDGRIGDAPATAGSADDAFGSPAPRPGGETTRAPRVLRSKSRPPRTSSNRRTALDNAGWVTSYSRAAALKEPVRETARA